MRSLLVFVWVLAATAMAWAGDLNPKAITVWEKLPAGAKVVASAPTEEALIEKTKPAVTFIYGNFDRMLVFTGKEGDGTRWFKLATARCLAEKGKPVQWVTVAADEPALAGETVPVTKIGVTDWKRNEKQLVRTPWARVAERHNELGTVYEIAFFTEPCGCGAMEQRLVVMHDPKNGWRLVGLFNGDVADDAEVTTADTRVGFDAAAKEKVHVTVNFVTTERPENAPFARTWRREEFYSGALPLMMPTLTSESVDVRVGETLSGLVRTLVDATPLVADNVARQAFRKALMADIVKRNEMTETSVLVAGRQLKLPSFEERLKMAKAIAVK